MYLKNQFFFKGKHFYREDFSDIFQSDAMRFWRSVFYSTEMKFPVEQKNCRTCHRLLICGMPHAVFLSQYFGIPSQQTRYFRRLSTPISSSVLIMR